MHTIKKAIAGGLLAGAAAVPLAVASSSPAEAAPCFTPDSVSVSNQGVTASGVVNWAGYYSGAYRISVSNTADGYEGRLIIDYYKHGIGWVDRETWSSADGQRGGVASRGFAKGYQIDKIRVGVARQGAYVYQLVFDVNSACGA